MQSTGNLAKIFFLLTLTLLMNNVEVYADNEKKPNESEYFDLVVTPDTNKNGKSILTFKVSNDSCGYMVQSPVDKNNRYYIFTTKKWIRVTDAKLGKTTNVKYKTGFDYQISKGTWKKGGDSANEINESYRSEGYILVQNIVDNNKYKFTLQNNLNEKEYDFEVIPSDYLKLKNITVTINNRDRDAKKKDALLTLVDVNFNENKLDTVKVYAGDLVKIKVRRKARGVLNSVKFNDVILDNSYFLYKEDKEHREIDDIVQTTASINFDSVQMPIVEKIEYYKLNVYYSTIEENELVGKEKTIIIEVNPLPAIGILRGDINITYLIIAVIATLLVIGVIIFVLCRKKCKNQADLNLGNNLHWVGKSESETMSAENESNTNNEVTKLDSTPVVDISTKSIFKNIKDSDVAEFLLGYLSSTFPKIDANADIKEIETYINKLWVRKFCNEWNSKHSENQIPGDSFSVEGIFKTIETGYIGPNARAKLDEYDTGKIRETKGYIEVLRKFKEEIANETWRSAYTNAKEEVVVPIKSLLNELGYEVASVEDSADMNQLKSVIKDSIRKGAETVNKLQNSVRELEDKIADNENTLDAALKERERGLKTIYQQELDAKQNTIDSLNDTIEQKSGEIIHLQNVAHDDCNGYIDIVIKQLATVSECMNCLLNGAINASGDDSQYSNVLRNAKESFMRFNESVYNSNNKDKWRDNSYSLFNVRKDLQGYVEEGLRINGWINIIAYLNLYAGATAELNENFRNNGVSSAELSRCYSEIQKLLGMFGVSVMVPHLLYEKFDKNYYKHENGDKWITTYSSKLSPRDYDGIIFDMSNVGYQIDDEEYNKPKVFYN